MSGLVLKLSAGERILINGAVIENGPRRAKLVVCTPKANILRLRDAIHPDQTDTPVRRICYAAQLVVAGESESGEVACQIHNGIGELGKVFRDAESREVLGEAKRFAEQGNYYHVLKSMRNLLPLEETLLRRAVH